MRNDDFWNDFYVQLRTFDDEKKFVKEFHNKKHYYDFRKNDPTPYTLSIIRKKS